MFRFVRSRHGFTLIELLVVVAAISLLASIAFANYRSGQAEARDQRRITDIEQIALALRLYYEQYGGYPCHAGGGPNCTGLITSASGEIGDNGNIDAAISPYLESVPADPLGPGDPDFRYMYRSNTCGGPDQKVIIFAETMEVPSLANGASVICSGGGFDTESYVIVLGNSSG